MENLGEKEGVFTSLAKIFVLVYFFIKYILRNINE